MSFSLQINEEAGKDGQAQEEQKASTISLHGKRGYDQLTDFVVICKCSDGAHARFKVHKQALRAGSTFLNTMFQVCGRKEQTREREVEDQIEEDELELLEPSAVTCILIYTIYGEVTALRNQLGRIREETDASGYSR